MKKSLLYIISTLLLLCACSTSGKQTDFVTAKDGKFFVGDKEYRYVGANFWYGAILGSTGRGGNRERLIKELDDMKALGMDNVRVLVGGDGREGLPSHIEPVLQSAPGEYNDTILEGLDYLMAELEKRDMKAILYLNNSWEWSGGFGTYLEWAGHEMDYTCPDGSFKHFDKTPIPSIDGYDEYTTFVSAFMLNDTAKAFAADHVRFIVSRTNTITGKPYSESPALMAWEIANEPRCFASDSLHKAKFEEWIDAQSTLIKSLDPNHLVTTGSEGLYGCQVDMDLFVRLHSLPNIDYACIHIWPYNWAWLGENAAKLSVENAGTEADPIIANVDSAKTHTLDYLNGACEALRGTGLPIVLEEFGYPRDGFSFKAGSPTKGRDEYYRYVFSLVRDSGKVAGCNFWGWGGSADAKDVVWKRWNDYVCDPAQEEQGLNSVFLADSSTIQIIKEMTSQITK